MQLSPCLAAVARNPAGLPFIRDWYSEGPAPGALRVGALAAGAAAVAVAAVLTSRNGHWHISSYTHLWAGGRQAGRKHAETGASVARAPSLNKFFVGSYRLSGHFQPK